MFRRQVDTLGPDPAFPADLKQLGFFINTTGHIRMIDAPEKDYVYHSTSDERTNEVRREAMQTCSREEVQKRLCALGLEKLYFPDLTTEKPNGPHVPILVPSKEVLKIRKRIIVLINDSSQDLGILAYRQLQRELGLNGGSVVNFIKELILESHMCQKDYDQSKIGEIFEDGVRVENEKEIPGLIMLNTGQLFYSHKFNNALSLRSWSAMPRKTISHDMIRIHEEENRVEGHRSAEEHIRTVFDSTVMNRDFVASDAEVYVVAIEDGVENLMNVLNKDFDKFGSRITALAIINSPVDGSSITNPKLKAFLHQRTRQWKAANETDPETCIELPDGYRGSDKSNDTDKAKKPISWLKTVSPSGTISPITNPTHLTTAPQQCNSSPSTRSSNDGFVDADVISPTFAGGEHSNSIGECVFTSSAVRMAIVHFFQEVAQDPGNYRNPYFSVGSGDDEQGFPCALPEITTKQQELDQAKLELEDSKQALRDLPANHPQRGKFHLEKKIGRQEQKLQELAKEALAKGGLKAGEAQEQRENWHPPKTGPKVPFAGAQIDSEALKGAGLTQTAEEELEKLEISNEK